MTEEGIGIILRVSKGTPKMKIAIRNAPPGDVALALFNLKICQEKLEENLRQSTNVKEDKPEI